MRLRPPAAVLSLVALLAAGCSSDPQETYCRAVEAHQGELTEIAASDDSGAVLDALDAYDDLASKAPRDIADDWEDVIVPLRDLQQALGDNGVDPSAYSAEKPPAGVDQTAQGEIEAAAREVGSERTVAAMAAVEQQALDVCGTPLSR
ncbi:hypothetical protein [Nocardioides hwasunensis]|uniref:Uncharacterized protein n=1 Tax=Nocardioides hwasunensis TaxID=397258 RepID=A0ABR8MIF1_9ACTN|nr:hypothetical protein [Nocardioides hwasunensis]MBD3914505.1 hypothetical protein [Nocardioides hwasunensis]